MLRRELGVMLLSGMLAWGMMLSNAHAQSNRALAGFDRAPIRNASASPTGVGHGRQLSVEDLLNWQRLAQNVDNDGPRIDGTSAVDGPPAPSDAGEIETETPANDGVAPSLPLASSLRIPDDITPAELLSVIRLLQQQVDTNTELIGNNAILVQQLKSQLNDVTDNLNRNLSEQQSILQQQQQILNAQQAVIDSVTPEDENGDRVLRLDGISLSSEFVQDVDSAIRQQQPQDGSIVIRNPLGYDQVVVVNDQQHTVVAGATLTIRVPVGNVFVRIPDGSSYTWFVNSAQNTIRLKLVPPDLGR